MLRKPASLLRQMGRRSIRTGSLHGAVALPGLPEDWLPLWNQSCGGLRTPGFSVADPLAMTSSASIPLMPAASAFGHIDSSHGGLPLGPDLGYEPPKEPDDYQLSIGKITDVLRSDYPDFFERTPDLSIYDEHVNLELGKPLEEPKVLAKGKSQYCRILLTIRRICSSMVRNRTVSCQVCDGRPYGFALRVYWKCQGEIWLGSLREFHISAVSFYSVAPQKMERGEALQFLAYRIHRHTLDITEIRPSSLQNRLLDVIMPQADVEPSLAVRTSFSQA
mmetsp:Transcript_78735/g.138930  ORF Transcript_78735/g.138930 Transcript_78735/m.138930 type:complete len:277 (+) Transcript_78735:394-1224(+)